MTKRQLDLKLGPILGQITARALTVVQRIWKRKWWNTHRPPHEVSCVMLKWSAAVNYQNIKSPAFLVGKMSEPQITGHF